MSYVLSAIDHHPRFGVTATTDHPRSYSYDQEGQPFFDVAKAMAHDFPFLKECTPRPVLPGLASRHSLVEVFDKTRLIAPIIVMKLIHQTSG